MGENNGLDGLGSNVNLNKNPEQQNNYGQAQQNYDQAQQNNYGQAQQNYGQFQQSQAGTDNQQYGQNGQGFNQYSQQPNAFDNMAAMGGGLIGVNAPDYMLWLVLGILQIVTICCCNCMAPITGIITVVLVVMANTSYKQGNTMDYMSKMKVGKIVCCIGYGLMIIGWILSFVSGLFSSMLSMFD